MFDIISCDHRPARQRLGAFMQITEVTTQRAHPNYSPSEAGEIHCKYIIKSSQWENSVATLLGTLLQSKTIQLCYNSYLCEVESAQTIHFYGHLWCLFVVCDGMLPLIDPNVDKILETTFNIMQSNTPPPHYSKTKRTLCIRFII